MCPSQSLGWIGETRPTPRNLVEAVRARLEKPALAKDLRIGERSSCIFRNLAQMHRLGDGAIDDPENLAGETS